MPPGTGRRAPSSPRQVLRLLKFLYLNNNTAGNWRVLGLRPGFADLEVQRGSFLR